MTDRVVVSGERGPTGDHGQAGDRGHRGETGREGVRGLEGPVGHIGLTGPPARSNVLLAILKTLTLLMGAVIVAAAMWLNIDAAKDENRLVADRDAERQANAQLRTQIDGLRDQVDTILSDRANERFLFACRNLYEDDHRIAESRVLLGLWEFLELIILSPPDSLERESGGEELVRRGAERRDQLVEAERALTEYAEMNPPPTECPHPDAARITAEDQ